jgi:hypothetical protein
MYPVFFRLWGVRQTCGRRGGQKGCEVFPGLRGIHGLRFIFGAELITVLCAELCHVPSFFSFVIPLISLPSMVMIGT